MENQFLHQVNKSQVEQAIIDILNGNSKYFPFELEPLEINNGSCEDFAFAVMAHLNYPANLYVKASTMDQPDLWGHVWLELHDKQAVTYFDAEVEYGVESVKELPYFIRN
jgi:hypothetical protein